MKPIVANPDLVAACGLYFGACGSYLRDRCPGCKKNDGATWCGIRKCCGDAGRSTCAECPTHANPRDCKLFHNFISRVIGFFLRSDRAACIRQIREKGLAGHAEDMAKQQRHSLPRQ